MRIDIMKVLILKFLRELVKSLRATVSHNNKRKRKLHCKCKDRVASEYKNNIVYEIHCNNYEAVYLSESKCCDQINTKDLSKTVIVKRMKM